MNANKIVIHHVQRHGASVVLNLFLKCVCRSSEAAHRPV
jgi:hypothetical protein